jgi:ATP synthase F1 delta subunit
VREAVRGYASASLEPLDDARLAGVQTALRVFAEGLAASAELLDSLGDQQIPGAVRSAIVIDLLGDAPSEVRGMIDFVVRSEPASELGADLDWLVTRALDETGRRAGDLDPDPPAGHSAVNERLEGFAAACFASIEDGEVIDGVEDDLFRLARLLEANRELNDTLSNFDLPASVREDILAELLKGHDQPVTLALLRYAIRQTRGQLVSHLDWLSARVAEERGRRSATVSSAVELDPAQQERLVAGLSALTGRRVSLKLHVDPELIGGVRVEVGDTVLDGTVRRRLQQVGDVLVHGSRQRSGIEERPS